jgi:hypothetical protein
VCAYDKKFKVKSTGLKTGHYEDVNRDGLNDLYLVGIGCMCTRKPPAGMLALRDARELGETLLEEGAACCAPTMKRIKRVI